MAVGLILLVLGTVQRAFFQSSRGDAALARFSDGHEQLGQRLGGGAVFLQILGTYFIVASPIWYVAIYSKQHHWSTHILFLVVAAVAFLVLPYLAFIGYRLFTSAAPSWMIPRKYRH